MLLALGFYIQGCRKEPPFPAGVADLRLNLSTIYIDFKAMLQYRTFEKPDRDQGVWSVGYGGILVHIDMNSEYIAYDMACPYEMDPTIKVRPDDSAVRAVCEKCGSTFEIASAYGSVEKGPAKQPLKRYKTSLMQMQESVILRVYN